jgi:hypothetical protein
MPRISPGFRPLFVQIPETLFDKLAADANESGRSMGEIVTRLLRREYKVPEEDLPRRRRSGRPPETKKEKE